MNDINESYLKYVCNICKKCSDEELKNELNKNLTSFIIIDHDGEECKVYKCKKKLNCN